MLSFISVLVKFSPQSCHSEERRDKGSKVQRSKVAKALRYYGSKFYKHNGNVFLHKQTPILSFRGTRNLIMELECDGGTKELRLKGTKVHF
jgi:hypothetical protein